MSSSDASPRDLFSIESMVVVISGGTGRLGSRFAVAMLERGAAVAALDVDATAERASAVFGRWADSDRLRCLSVDVTDKGALDRALADIELRLGTPSGLITCAAIDTPPEAPASENPAFEDYSEAAWRRVLDVNVTGVFLTCQTFGSAMARAGRGSIVNVSSIYGLVSPDQRIYDYRRMRGDDFHKPVGYAVSKSAILNLTRYLATHWAPRGVRVNTITFGGVADGQDAQFVEAYSARTPLGRMARPDEYTGAAIFLLSEASSYMTGSNLTIDGGWTAW